MISLERLSAWVVLAFVMWLAITLTLHYVVRREAGAGIAAAVLILIFFVLAFERLINAAMAGSPGATRTARKMSDRSRRSLRFAGLVGSLGLGGFFSSSTLARAAVPTGELTWDAGPSSVCALRGLKSR